MAVVKAARVFGWITRNVLPGAFTTLGYAQETYGPVLKDGGLPLFSSGTTDLDQCGKLEMLEEVITIAAAATSNSANTALLPANSEILCIRGMTIVTTTTATTYSVGEATTAARFGSGYSFTVPSVGSPGWVYITHRQPANTNVQGSIQLADAGIRITPNATPGNALGRVLIQVIFIRWAAPIRVT